MIFIFPLRFSRLAQSGLRAFIFLSVFTLIRLRLKSLRLKTPVREAFSSNRFETVAVASI